MGAASWELIISMRDGEKLGLEQIRALVSASAEVAFEGQQRKEVYGWVERVLREQQYRQQGRAARGLLRQYVVKMTGLSRAQATRLMGRYLEQGTVSETKYCRHRFTQRYTRADMELLAACHQSSKNVVFWTREQPHPRRRRESSVGSSAK